jgi:hypothetical protein
VQCKEEIPRLLEVAAVQPGAGCPNCTGQQLPSELRERFTLEQQEERWRPDGMFGYVEQDLLLTDAALAQAHSEMKRLQREERGRSCGLRRGFL